jgi:hypothetical protein
LRYVRGLTFLLLVVGIGFWYGSSTSPSQSIAEEQRPRGAMIDAALMRVDALVQVDGIQRLESVLLEDSGGIPAQVLSANVIAVPFVTDHPFWDQTVEIDVAQQATQLRFHEGASLSSQWGDDPSGADFRFANNIDDGIYTLALTRLGQDEWPGQPTGWGLVAGIRIAPDGVLEFVDSTVLDEAWSDAMALLPEGRERTGLDALLELLDEYEDRRASGRFEISDAADFATSAPEGSMRWQFGELDRIDAPVLGEEDVVAIWEAIPRHRRGLDPEIVPSDVASALLRRQIVIRIEDPDQTPGAGVFLLTESGVAYAAETAAGSHAGHLFAMAGETIEVAVTADIDRPDEYAVVGSIVVDALTDDGDAVYVHLPRGAFGEALNGESSSRIVVARVGAADAHELVEWTSLDEWRLADANGTLDAITREALLELESRLGASDSFELPGFMR